MWESDFIKWTLMTLAQDKPGEILFACRPQDIVVSERVGMVWHRALPVTRDIAGLPCDVEIGQRFLTAFRELGAPICVTAIIDGTKVLVRMSIEFEGETVHLIPNAESSV